MGFLAHTSVKTLSRGIDFVGFRNFYYFRLLRKRNKRKMFLRVEDYKDKRLSYEKLKESFQSWQAYAKWANSLKLKVEIEGIIKTC